MKINRRECREEKRGESKRGSLQVNSEEEGGSRLMEEKRKNRARSPKEEERPWLAGSGCSQTTNTVAAPPCLSLSPEEEGGRRFKVWLLLLENTRCRPPDLIMQNEEDI